MKPLPILAAFLCAFGGFTQAAEGPNIILLMGDDHGWEETGYNGHPHVHTPVLDEIAATGLRFDRFYAAHPSCSPTRASRRRCTRSRRSASTAARSARRRPRSSSCCTGRTRGRRAARARGSTGARSPTTCTSARRSRATW